MDPTPEQQQETEHVEFDWDTKYGECYDCSLPAAYETPPPAQRRLCSVCAAQTAAEGETIIYLFAEAITDGSNI